MPTKSDLASLKLHPDSQLVPAMRKDEYASLLQDIEKRGIVVPLDCADRIVLDGRHRLQAAKDLGLATVPTRQVTVDGGSATEYLLKAAVLRRHLTDDQRAVMAAMWAKENRKPTGAAAHKDKSYPTRVSVGKAALQPALASASATVKVPITRAVRAAEVLRKSPALAKQVHSGEIPLKQAIKNIRLEEQEKAILAHTPAEGVFDVIVVDPPWPYEKRSGDITHRGACPYPTMSLEEIRALKIPAASDCILWLWTTNAFMREAFTLLDAWGFQEKTILTWFKDSMGLGDWLRGKTEHCILAVRGKPFHVLTNQTTALQGPRREHSRKPDEFFALAELISPHGRRLEMFAREERPGWTSCGAEMGQFP